MARPSSNTASGWTANQVMASVGTNKVEFRHNAAECSADGIGAGGAFDVLYHAAMTWDYIARVRDAAPFMKVVLKGIVTREDALLALRYAVDAVVVSNHGGRAEESGRSTITSLPEVVTAVRHRIPVLLDGGIRRGTDIFKALALGARAVGVGRPYLWGLAAFGQPGVEAVLAMLRSELALIMRQAGTTSLGAITPARLEVPNP